MSSLSLRTKLLVLIASSLIGMLGIALWSLATLSGTLQQASADKTRDLVATAASIVRRYEERRDLDEKVAQQQAITALDAMRFGDDGYFFILDKQLRYLHHPITPQLQGSSTLSQRLPDNTRLGDLLAKALQGDHLLTYAWQKPGSSALVDKQVALASTPRWGWVIGTGIYVDHIERTVQTQAIQLLAGIVLVMAICLALGSYIIRLVIRTLGGEPAEATRMVAAVAAGDLQTDPEQTTPPTGSLLHQIGSMKTQLRNMVADVLGHADKLVTVADQLNASVSQLNHSTERQSGAATAIAASVEQMNVGISHIADSSSHAANLGETARECSTAGRDIVSQAASEMDSIKQVVDNTARSLNELVNNIDGISVIVSMIKDVAEQTNLLALNAAIEAARAGEQGRGFAVVADEVRKLSERTAGATSEITGKIGIIHQLSAHTIQDMQEAIRHVGLGERCTREGVAAIGGIVTATGQVLQALHEISSAMSEQHIASNSIAYSVEGIASSASDTATASNQAARASDEMHQLAAQLHRAVNSFRL